MRTLLVGEQNPYGPDQRAALWPLPANAAGASLCRILGLTKLEYLRAFERANLLPPGRWSLPAARARAKEILDGRVLPVVALGARVAAAFGIQFEPFARDRGAGAAGAPSIYMLPHPSGRCRIWNEPGTWDRARRLLAPLVPVIAKRLEAT